MNIKITTNGFTDLDTGAFIPNNPDNDDYKIVQEWIAAGNTPIPMDTQPAPTLADLKATKSDQIKLACQNQIFAGFTSNALGSVYTYPAKSQDQINLTASYAASFDPANPANWTTPFWCEDSTGTWAYIQHTASQIQQVGRDGKAAITTALEKNEQLQQQITNAQAQADLDAINW